MFTPTSVLWIDFILAAGLLFPGRAFAQVLTTSELDSLDSPSRHSRPVGNPSAKGFLEQLPLTNPDLGYRIPTPPRLLPAEDGYWLAAGDDLYKLSPEGNILNHIVYPYSYSPSLSLPFWDAMAPYTGGEFFVLDNNDSSLQLPATLFLMDNDGQILRQWKMDLRMAFNQMISTESAIIIRRATDLLILSHEGQFMHYLSYNVSSSDALGEDALGRTWVGASGATDNFIEAKMFIVDANPTFAVSKISVGLSVI